MGKTSHDHFRWWVRLEQSNDLILPLFSSVVGGPALLMRLKSSFLKKDGNIVHFIIYASVNIT